MIIKDFIAWLEDVDPRVFYKSDILTELTEFGFDVAQDETTSTRIRFIVGFGDKQDLIYVNTWKDDFDSMVMRGLPFFVIDEAHVGEPQSMEKSGTGYAIIGPNDADMNAFAAMGVGYIFKNEESLRQTTVVGSAVIRSLAKLIAGVTPGDEYHGRGFAANANMKAIQEALGCYNEV